MGISQPSKSTSREIKNSIRQYWEAHLHDDGLSDGPEGSPEFFRDLEEYRFRKLPYLEDLLQKKICLGMRVLEVGCGIGIDLARIAHSGAEVTGIDLSMNALELAKEHFRQQGLEGNFQRMDGELLAFQDKSFDLTYAHGVLPYSPNPEILVSEIYRVLRDGGIAICMSYNRDSWLNWLSKLTRTQLEHDDAPVYRMDSASEFSTFFWRFGDVKIVRERFPVPTELHSGWKAFLFNKAFVGGFNALPDWFVEPVGWHLIAIAKKDRNEP